VADLLPFFVTIHTCYSHYSKKMLILLKGGNIYPKVMKVRFKKVMSFPYRSNYLSNSSSQHIQR